MKDSYNQSVVSKLSINHLKKYKGRAVITIIAIILTCIMLTSVLTITATVIESTEYSRAMQSGSLYHGVFKQLDDKDISKVAEHYLVDSYGISTVIGFLKPGSGDMRHYEVRTMSLNYIKASFLTPIYGELPKAKNEVVVDEALLDILDKEYDLNQDIPLKLQIGNKVIEENFLVTGISKSNKFSTTGFIIVSEEFKNQYQKKLNGAEDYGKTDVGVMFSSKFSIERKMMEVLSDFGEDFSEVEFGINWAYINNESKFEFRDLLVYSLLILMIMVSGYLFIYNIYYISVNKDIKYFGLLKAIGMTNSQIRKLVYLQGGLLYLISLPIGLFLGFLLGNRIVPYVLSSLLTEMVETSLNPWIYVFASGLTLITVYLSCMKPAKIAGNISPIEAVRLSKVKYTRNKVSRVSGGKIYKMAWVNIWRSKNKTLLVVLSITLSLVILSGAQVLINDFSPEKSLEKLIGSDYLIADSTYFNYVFKSQQIPSSIFDFLPEESYGFYRDKNTIELTEIQRNGIIEKSSNDKSQADGYINIGAENLKKAKMAIELFGADPYIIDKLKPYVIAGEIPNQLKENQIIIDNRLFTSGQGIDLDFKIGEKITMSDKSYTIVAKVTDLPLYLYDQSFRGYTVQGFTGQKTGDLMSIMVNGDIDVKLLEKRFPSSVINSRQTYIEASRKYLLVVKIIGYSLSLILSLIGVMNFLNMISTSIIARDYEFAVLESIGMTKMQLQKLFAYEGFYIVFMALLMSGICSMLIAALKGQYFLPSLFKPFYIVAVILMIITSVIPVVMYKQLNKKNLVNRLSYFR